MTTENGHRNGSGPQPFSAPIDSRSFGHDDEDLVVRYPELGPDARPVPVLLRDAVQDDVHPVGHRAELVETRPVGTNQWT